jgi:hypothetical protein
LKLNGMPGEWQSLAEGAAIIQPRRAPEGSARAEASLND